MEWIVAKSSSAAAKPYAARDTSVDRGIVRITLRICGAGGFRQMRLFSGNRRRL